MELEHPAGLVQSKLGGLFLRWLLESEKGQAQSAAPPRRAGHLNLEGSACRSNICATTGRKTGPKTKTMRAWKSSGQKTDLRKKSV